MWIDVEIVPRREDARILPAVEFVPRRHEGEPAAEIAQGRARQPFDQSLAVVALGLLGRDQQMLWRGECVFERILAHRRNNIGAQTLPFGELSIDQFRGSKVNPLLLFIGEDVWHAISISGSPPLGVSVWSFRLELPLGVCTGFVVSMLLISARIVRAQVTPA